MPTVVLAAKLDRKRTVDFLVELANSLLAEWPVAEDDQDEDGALARLRRRFEEFCPSEYPLSVAHTLRTAWEQPTLRGREAYLFGALTEARHRSSDESEFEKWDRIAAALFLAEKIVGRMRMCANPDCLTPCFLVQKRNQRYCSEQCSGEGRRQLKRTWWAEHGPEWREARKRAQAKKTRERKRR